MTVIFLYSQVLISVTILIMDSQKIHGNSIVKNKEECVWKVQEHLMLVLILILRLLRSLT